MYDSVLVELGMIEVHVPFMYICTCICTCINVHVNERCRRKEERSKHGQTNNNAKQHSTPKAVTFPKEK